MKNILPRLQTVLKKKGTYIIRTSEQIMSKHFRDYFHLFSKDKKVLNNNLHVIEKPKISLSQNSKNVISGSTTMNTRSQSPQKSSQIKTKLTKESDSPQKNSKILTKSTKNSQ